MNYEGKRVDYDSNAELSVQIARLARKVDYLFRHLGVEYAEESVPLYVLKAQELIKVGRDSDAIKIVREQTAVGMIEARAIVEDLARRVGRASLQIDSVVPPAGVAGAVHGVSTADDGSREAVEERWRKAVRDSADQRL